MIGVRAPREILSIQKKKRHNMLIAVPSPVQRFYIWFCFSITDRWFARQTTWSKAVARYGIRKGGCMGKEPEDSRYHVSDPFFVVECSTCGAKYWSTRRVNIECAKCGGGDVTTQLPEKRKEACTIE